MHTRSTAVLFALAVSVGSVACSGSRYQPPPNAARSVTAPALPQETTSVSGANGNTGVKSGAEPAQNPPAPPSGTGGGPNQLSPPPSAGTSTPHPTSPYKPGADPAPNTGGGPKTETGGSVYGDGNNGNTGVIKGGDPSAPKQ